LDILFQTCGASSALARLYSHSSRTKAASVGGIFLFIVNATHTRLFLYKWRASGPNELTGSDQNVLAVRLFFGKEGYGHKRSAEQSAHREDSSMRTPVCVVKGS
jgi:hypothetical protein